MPQVRALLELIKRLRAVTALMGNRLLVQRRTQCGVTSQVFAQSIGIHPLLTLISIMVILIAKSNGRCAAIIAGKRAVQVRRVAINVSGKGVKSPLDGLQIVFALHAVGFGLRLGQRGQQQTGEDADNGDHHQKLNERKRFFIHCYSF